MKIRRYFGFDADSVNGFNNGYYWDKNPIEVKGDSEAMKLCLDILKSNYVVKENDEGLTEDEDGYTLITRYSDDDGNELTRDEFMERNESQECGGYRYVFVNYYVVDEEE